MSIEAMKQALEELKPFASTEVWDKLPASAKVAILNVETALYKAVEQAGKREWVNLTDEEIKEIIGPWGETPVKGYIRKLFDQIEAKLKEKNS